MRSPNSERDCLPISGDAERPMTDARRNVAGRPEGQYERALKHGRYTTEAIARRRQISAWCALAKALREH
jgi:hypothetical protein